MYTASWQTDIPDIQIPILWLTGLTSRVLLTGLVQKIFFLLPDEICRSSSVQYRTDKIINSQPRDLFPGLYAVA